MPPPPSKEQTLTEDQQSLISETLSEYDADNLTQEDAISIREVFSEAGIPPGLALAKEVSASGFDAKNIGELAKVSDKGSRPPPPKQSTEEITSIVDYLAEVLKEKLAANNDNPLNDEDKQLILAQVIEEFNLEDGESIINTTA